MQLILEKDRLRIVEAALSVGKSHLAISGDVENLPEPVLELNLDAGLQAGELARFIAGNEDFSGNVELRFGVKGPLHTPFLTGRVNGNDIALGIYKGIGMDAGISWDSNAGVLTADPLAIRSTFGNLDGNASINTGSGNSSIHSTFKKVDLAKISQLLNLEMRIGGTASGSVDAVWPGTDWKDADGRADVRFVPQGKASKGFVPVQGRLDISAQSRRYQASTRELKVLGTRAAGSLWLDSAKNLGGSLQIEADDLAGVISQAGLFLGRDSFEFPFSGRARVASTLSGTIDNPKLVAEVHGDFLSYGGIRDISFLANAGYESRRLRIEQATLGWQGQSIRASGEIGLGDNQPGILLEMQGEGIELSPVLNVFMRDPPVEGLADFVARVTGSIDRPTVELEFAGSELNAYGESWGRLEVQAAYRDGSIEVKKLHLDKNGSLEKPGTLTGAGFYTPVSREYSFHAKTDLELISLILPGGQAVKGRFRGDLKGSGTALNPLADIAVEISNLALDSQYLGDFNVRAQLADRLVRAEIDAPDLGANAVIRTAVQSPYAGTFNIKTDIPDLAALSLRGPGDAIVHGSFSGTLQGKGEFSDWKSIDAVLQIQNALFIFNQQEFKNLTPITAFLKNGVISVDPSRVLAGRMQVNLSGSLPLESSESSGNEFIVDMQGNLESLLDYFPDMKSISAKGELQARALVRGGLDLPEPQIAVTIKDGQIALPGLPEDFRDIQLEVATRNREIVLDRFTAHWGGAVLEASAHAPFGFFSEKLRSGASTDAGFTATVRDLNPGFIPGAPEGLEGNISLKAEGRAGLWDPANVFAQVDFQRLQLKMKGLNLEQKESARIYLREGLVVVDRLEAAGSGIDLAIAGTARLTGMQDIDIRLTGKGDAGLFTSLLEGVRATGPSEFIISASGTIPDPQLTGDLTLHDGRIVLQSMPVQGEDINLALRFTPGLVEIVESTGALNGGRFNAMGSVAYEMGSIKNVNLSLDVDNLDMNFPKGLRTLSDSRIQVLQRDELILVEGKVTITDGSYRENLDLAGFLGSGGMQFVEDRNPFLSRVRFNIKIETAGPIVMDNRQARLMADSELTLVGTFYRPSITGRLTLEEGGEVTLAEHRYILDTGIIDFFNETKIEPSLNILARTRASGYDINLRIQGSPGRMETSFTSDPSLPEPDIISLLLTGRTLEEARGSSLNIARQHAMSYLTGQLGGRLSRSAEETLGLSRVRIEPNLVSGDSDPGARLTVGQDLRRDLRLVYSMNLVDSSDQILIGEYDLARRFTLRGTNQYDNSRRFDFQHDLRFGRKRIGSGRRDSSIVIGSIHLTGERVFPDALILDKLIIKTGQAYDFLRVRKGIERLMEYYRDNNYLEARIRLQQEKGTDTVGISYNINAGPIVEFSFEGFNLPDSLRKQVRQTWESGVFDAQRTGDAAAAIRRWFIKNRYLEANVLCTIRPSANGPREVFIRMDPGERYETLHFRFDGAGEVMPGLLEQTVRKEPEGIVDSILNPRKMADLLTQYYRQQGYSAARVDPPRLQLDPETSSGTIEFKTHEGPLFHIERIEFIGHRSLPEAELRGVMAMQPGAIFQPKDMRNTVEKLEELYWSRGYNDVRIEYRADRNEDGGKVNVQFLIDEQRQSIVGRVEVAGNENVDGNFIRNHLRLNEGDTLEHKKTELSRRALYKTGAFELVEMETDPLISTASDAAESKIPLLLRARVREVVPYKLRYGGFYDTDRGPGAIFDFENRNSLLGGARVLGGRFRYDSDLQESRGYFGQPLYFKFPSVASASVFVQRELHDAFITKRVGFSLQHEMELRENMIFSYGYRFENAHTFTGDPGLSPFVDTTRRIAPLTTSFSWSTRDDLMDATRGFFVSNALEYAPSFLGSDLPFMKYFGQIFKYVPLSTPTQVPFSRGVKRSRLLYAGGVRIGLAGGFGGNALPESERFFAGGGTTIRGFQQDAVGPENEFGDPVGGEAVFVFNNELRFPIKSIFEGIGFLDIGNVYPRVSDFNPTDVRSSAGPGIRVRTPYFLLRFDYGFKLNPKSGESPGAFYFSVGQAF
ncbi:MAG: translocation/assembly module TamB domain-containing protein [Acidobacteria bacterium]|nr:translocation/assembly module TamB domain-containing protein [Acidobacteriota bacterium]